MINAENTAKIALTTKVIKNAFTALMLEGKEADLQRFAETLMPEDIHKLRILKPDGTVMLSSDPEEKGSKIKPAKDIFGTEIIPRNEGQYTIYLMQMPIYNEKHCAGCHGANEAVIGILNVEIVTDNIQETIRDLRTNTLLFYIIMFLILSISLGIMTTFLVTRPLKSIIESAKMVEEGNHKVKFDLTRKDEIGELANGLNSMLSELHRARQAVEQCHMESMQKVEKMATLGELASAIAHEIKNPLAGISGAIQVFAEDFPEDDPRKDIITEVLKEIDRLDKAVRDLLSFARPPEPHRIKTPILPLIERTVRLISMQAKKHSVDINMAAVDDIKEVSLDPEQMQQVFLNIMLNALHSMPGGGVITVTTYFKDDPGQVEIIISDTGHGIPPDDIKNIFKPFFTTKHTGTGIGLAISKNIVEKHGGNITVDSSRGMGSNFRITLPIEVENV